MCQANVHQSAAHLLDILCSAEQSAAIGAQPYIEAICKEPMREGLYYALIRHGYDMADVMAQIERVVGHVPAA